jgi:hypothetical protein
VEHQLWDEVGKELGLVDVTRMDRGILWMMGVQGRVFERRGAQGRVGVWSRRCDQDI